jgi:hypothetical protein
VLQNFTYTGLKGAVTRVSYYLVVGEKNEPEVGHILNLNEVIKLKHKIKRYRVRLAY